MYKLLAEERPDLLEEWNYERNTDDVNKIGYLSNKKVWWKCSKNPSHEWQTVVYSRSRKYQHSTGCPFCYTEPKPGNTLLEKYPEIANQWHPIKNSPLTPDKVDSGSGKKVWWVCSKDSRHEWKAIIAYRKNYGCPYCSGMKVDSTNCLATIRPDIAEEWHPNKNTSTPYQVTSQSNKKVWWKCKNNHEYECKVYAKYRYGCPYCSNKKVDISNCLETTHPDIAQQWDYIKNYPHKPVEVVAGSKKSFWWICPKNSNHSWKIRVCSRTGPRPNHCPFCDASTGEEKIAKYLDAKNIKYSRQYTFPDCKNKSTLFFDFAVFNGNNLLFLIEYNGLQHYKPVEYFGGQKAFDDLRANDEVKVKYCMDNNIRLITIPHTEYVNIEKILDEAL